MPHPDKRRFGHAVRQITPAALGFAVSVAVAYPGFIDVDASSQWVQARTHRYNDWYPPLMAWVWSWTDRALPGPAGMLLLQNTLFWGALALIGRRRRHGLAVLTVGLWPAVHTFLGPIWKDTLMATALLAAFALLLAADERESVNSAKPKVWEVWPELAGAALLVFLACGCRHNAIAAALPLVAWMAAIIARRTSPRALPDANAAPPDTDLAPPDTRRAPRLRRRLTALLALILVAALASATHLASRALTGGVTRHVAQQALIHDLVAFSLAEHRDLAGLCAVPEDACLAAFAARYEPQESLTIFLADPPPRTVEDEAGFRALTHAWLAAVATHPGIFLAKHAALFSRLTGWRGVPAGIGFHNYVADPYATHYRPSAAADAVYGAFMRHQESWIFRGWIYLAALAAMTAWAAWRRDMPALVLGASGLVYAASLFAFAPSQEFRYLGWLIIATACMPVVMTPKPPPAGAHT